MKLTLGALMAALALTGCTAQAQFHSKTGRDYAMLTERAVQCNENEASSVLASGGFVIGVIDAPALAINASDGDLDDKTSREAARHGGTHFVLTRRGSETFTTITPEQTRRDCVRMTNGELSCRTLYTPLMASTVEKPTANYVVFAVPSSQWGTLPPSLQPMPAH